MVLDLAQHDDVTRAQVLASPGEGGKVDRLGRVLREDDLAVRVRRADESAESHPCRLELAGRLFGDGVDAAVDVGVGGRVVVVHRVEHRLGALGGGGGVEVDERAVGLAAREEREVLLQRWYVDGVGHGRHDS